jgi:hypothetical protein
VSAATPLCLSKQPHLDNQEKCFVFLHLKFLFWNLICDSANYSAPLML